MSDWLQYRLEALDFHNGAELSFPNARMHYRTDDREILIKSPGGSPAEVAASLKQIAKANGSLPFVKTIYYKMVVAGYGDEQFFFHPASVDAWIALQMAGEGSALLLRQVEGRTIFSKDWTMRDVSEGRIPIDRAVWQFHGYKHEH